METTYSFQMLSDLEWTTSHDIHSIGRMTRRDSSETEMAFHMEIFPLAIFNLFNLDGTYKVDLSISAVKWR